MNRQPQRILVTLLAGFVSVAVNAETTITGQLQLELANWDSGSAGMSEWQITDGGTHNDLVREFDAAGNETRETSHNQGSASFIGIMHRQHLNPEYTGTAYVTFDIDWQGKDKLTEREFYIGLHDGKTNWRAGRMSSPYKESTLSWDPFAATFMQARGNGSYSTHNLGYYNEAIRYDSTWWGIGVGAMLALDKRDRDNDGKVNGKDSYSVVLSKSWRYADLVLGYLDDKQKGPDNLLPLLTATPHGLGSAVKAATKFHVDGHSFIFQYEKLDSDPSGEGWHSHIGYDFSNDKFTVAFALGRGLSDTDTITRRDYGTIGLKYAFSKNMLTHIGYRSTRTPDNKGFSESVYGGGLRILF